jgi:electron transport complex protein RnfE
MDKYTKQMYAGIIKDNPIFVMMLGMCPTLAVTTSAFNGLGMGLTTTAVLICSNLIISLLRNIIPVRVRIPSYIVIVASLVTVVQFLLKAYFPELDQSLGIYIPLIVVNCIILGRAESFASKEKPALAVFDGIGMGLGFALGLTAIGLFRELLGAGTAFGNVVMPTSYEPISIFVLAPGAFFVLAMLTALQNKFQLKSATNKPDTQTECNGNCGGCNTVHETGTKKGEN